MLQGYVWGFLRLYAVKTLASDARPQDASTDACALRHPLPLGFLRVSLDGITAAGPLPSTAF